MGSILMHLVPAALYAGLGLHNWRSRRQEAVLEPARGPQPWHRAVLLAALLLQGIALYRDIFPGSEMRFGFGLALALMVWLALAVYWVESWFARIDGLQTLGLPAAAVCALLPVIFPTQHAVAYVDSPIFRAHFTVAMLAYSLFALAALHAVLMATAEKRLHGRRLSRALAHLPPLMTMESLLFRLLWAAFILLTLTVGSGILFSESLFGKPVTLNHKTVFGAISWLIFAALLAGRHMRGWRGRTAVRWTVAGFAVLLLAYVGSRFVLEVVLGRGT